MGNKESELLSPYQKEREREREKKAGMKSLFINLRAKYRAKFWLIGLK